MNSMSFGRLDHVFDQVHQCPRAGAGDEAVLAEACWRSSWWLHEGVQQLEWGAGTLPAWRPHRKSGVGKGRTWPEARLPNGAAQLDVRAAAVVIAVLGAARVRPRHRAGGPEEVGAAIVILELHHGLTCGQASHTIVRWCMSRSMSGRRFWAEMWVIWSVDMLQPTSLLFRVDVNVSGWQHTRAHGSRSGAHKAVAERLSLQEL